MEEEQVQGPEHPDPGGYWKKKWKLAIRFAAFAMLMPLLATVTSMFWGEDVATGVRKATNPAMWAFLIFGPGMYAGQAVAENVSNIIWRVK